MGPHETTSAICDKRKQYVGPNVALSYSQPVHLVRGEKCYMYDDQGRQYLDCVNNVAHVGHAHPKVNAATCDQLRTLNTNCRYLHSGLPSYAQQLIATMPQPLQYVYFVCSGSEANDLALRIAESATSSSSPHPSSGSHSPMHIAVLNGAYHGHVSSLIQCSPYKFMNPGGVGKSPHVHVMPFPDLYRGTNLDGRAAARVALNAARESGGRLGAFIAESVMSCAGQIVFPDGYLQGVYEEMRSAGVVCIADEVQCGFGRVGAAFWGFELQGVLPDIVTVGKPMGNGFPMGALITTKQMAAAFNNGMEYFSTYGGCTAAMATGMAVLKVIKEEGLQDNARQTGEYILKKLRETQKAHPDVIGDVRGVGFMIGIEFVTDQDSKCAAPALAQWVKEAARERLVLLTTDGMLENVIKIKPPMCFGVEDADRMVEVIQQILSTKLTEDVKHTLIQDSKKFVETRQKLWKSLELTSSKDLKGGVNGYINGMANGDSH